jgi:predicted amidohydrolase
LIILLSSSSSNLVSSAAAYCSSGPPSLRLSASSSPPISAGTSLVSTTPDTSTTAVVDRRIMSKGIAAIAQLCSTNCKKTNYEQIEACALLAVQAKASMLFLPEAFAYIGSSSVETVENAEVIGVAADDGSSSSSSSSSSTDGAVDTAAVAVGPTLSFLSTLAKRHNIWISGGGLHEAGAPSCAETGNARVYNTHVILDNNGLLKAKYRKIHLFDVAIPEKNVFLKESASTAAGDKLVLCNSPLGVLGLATCYDMRFPEQVCNAMHAK